MIDYKSYIQKGKEQLRSTTGRNILTFLIFLVISTIFWFLMALNDEVQHDYKVPLRLEEFPKGVTVISGNIPFINVTVKDKGSALAKFSFGADPVLKLRYADFSHPADNSLLLTEAQLNSSLRGIFGNSASIVATRPDSLFLLYTTNPGIPVKVMLDAEVTPLPQYELFGQPRLSQDSVLLYSNLKERSKIKQLSTVPVSLTQLSDTTTVEVRIDVPNGMRAVPSTIKVTFPIEPLVSKTRHIKIETINVPQGMRLITFPATMEVSYLLPKSLYSHSNTPLRAVVDYNDITSGCKTVPVEIIDIPSYYKSVRPSIRDVEFLVERD